MIEIRSHTAFRAWLRERGQAGQWFGRVGFGERSLLVSRKRILKFCWDKWTPDELPLYPLQLPPLSPAGATKAWWKEIFEQRMPEYFKLGDGERATYALIRVGTWRTLPDWCVLRSKAEWEVISEQTFEAQVGAELFLIMHHECQFLGFSIRNLAFSDSGADEGESGAKPAVRQQRGPSSDQQQ